ncbi:MAG TPA: glycosyltransferase family 2 protein [Leptolyngbyaceae cyanobacterium]
MKIAILMTCHNRREHTLNCLEKVYQQNLAVDLYLVDDGSTDGTWEAVKKLFPIVKLIKGNGNLFWGGGMQLAFLEAMKFDYDYYIWLNDDIQLVPNALKILLDTHIYLAERGYHKSIVTGSLQDPITGMVTYGGRVRLKPWHPLKFGWVKPTEKPLECETMNGNCVLIPNAVAKEVGNIDPIFTHRRGDFDYGLRARKLGCSIWVAPGYVGTCARNSISGTYMDVNLSLRERLKKLDHPKELSSKEWKLYVKRHGGKFWFLFWLNPYVSLIISSVLHKIKVKKTDKDSGQSN